LYFVTAIFGLWFLPFKFIHYSPSVSVTQYRVASTDKGATAQAAKLNPEATLINLKQQRGYYLNILIQYNLPQFSNNDETVKIQIRPTS
jgi:hypothetical protein